PPISARRLQRLAASVDRFLLGNDLRESRWHLPRCGAGRGLRNGPADPRSSKDDRMNQPAVTVDAHHHLWRLRSDNYNWIRERSDALNMIEITRDFEAAEFRDLLERNGVLRSVLVQGELTVEETNEMVVIARKLGSSAA